MNNIKYTLRLLSACAMVASSAFAGAVTVQDGILYGRPVKTLDNGLIRISVTPEIGGRVLEFVNLRTGGDLSQIRLDNIHLTPEDKWEGAEYGGITDAATSGWPGPFWAQTYSLTVEDAPDEGKTLVARHTANDIEIERRMTVSPDSTAVPFSITQKNVSDFPQKMTVRLHNELAAGKRADAQDSLFFKEKEGLKQVDFVPGAEYMRFSWFDVVEPWIGIVDRTEQDGYFRLLSPEQEKHKFFYWIGFNESPEKLGREGAFFALDWYAMEETVQPGESLEITETFVLFDGMERIDFTTKEGAAGSLELDRNRYGGTDTLKVHCSMVSAEDFPETSVAIQITDGSTVLWSGKGAIPGSKAGKASTTTISWNYENKSDGTYFVKAEFFDADKNLLAATENEFEIVAELVQHTKDELRKRSQAIASLKKIQITSSVSTSQIETELNVLDLRIMELQKLFASGQYEVLLEKLPQVDRDIEQLQKIL